MPPQPAVVQPVVPLGVPQPGTVQPMATPQPGAVQPAVTQPAAMQPVSPQVTPLQPTSSVAEQQAYAASPTGFATAQPQYQQAYANTYAPVSANTQSTSKKKLLTWLVPGAAVLVIAVLAVLLLPKLFSVSQADYKKANDVSEEARTAYNKISSVYITTSSTATEVKNDTDTIKTSFKTFSEKFDELGKLKAVKRDKDIAQLYKTADEKKVKFDAAMTTVIEVYEKILPALEDESYSSAEGVEVLTRMRQSLESVTGLKDSINTDFVKDTVAKLKELEVLAAKVEAGRADYKKYDSTATSAYYDGIDKLTDISSAWQSNLEKKVDDSSVRSEMSKLSDKIFEKSLKT
jgi:hypothetical protein